MKISLYFLRHFGFDYIILYLCDENHFSYKEMFCVPMQIEHIKNNETTDSASNHSTLVFWGK